MHTFTVHTVCSECLEAISIQRMVVKQATQPGETVITRCEVCEPCQKRLDSIALHDLLVALDAEDAPGGALGARP